MAAPMLRSVRRLTWRRRRWLTVASVISLSGLALLYVDSRLTSSIRFRLRSALLGVTFESDGLALDTSGCRMTSFDPWMTKTRHFFARLEAEPCPLRPEEALVSLRPDGWLVVDQGSKVRLERKGSRKRKWRRRKKPRRRLSCRKWSIHRRPVEDDDGTYRINNTFTEFDNQTAMDSEFLQVECSINGGYPVYRDVFYSVPLKPEVEASCASNARHFLSGCEPPSCMCGSLPSQEPRLSVLVIGVDSVSKANFLRQFPLTHRLLTGSDFQALDFLGYNKVGLNTFPCLMPYLTGQSVEELVDGCWGGPTNFFDNCSTLWDSFAAAGYRTAFVENLANFGLFTYNKLGFRRQPAHYYGWTLYMPVLKHVRGFQSGCWRGMADDAHVLRWALHFQRTFARRPHFGHFWVSRFSHDDVNGAQHLDPLLSAALTEMTGLLNGTLLVLMSDHGIRYGGYRETDVGRMEENLPFMYFSFPPWFRDKHPWAMQQLEVNRHRLVTTYDLHATLTAIINCDYGEDDTRPSSRQRAVSLFCPVSPERTCEDAGIPLPYCACQQQGAEVQLDIASAASVTMALVAVGALNKVTSARRGDCEEFHLESVVSVTQKSGSGIFVVALVVAPGGGRFEATVVRDNGADRVHPDIRRLNSYGDSSWCVRDDHFLKSVCLCKSLRT